MKPLDEARRRLVEQWLIKADQDFGAARQLFTEGAHYPSVIGFHCQQAIEKNLKAFLTWHSIEFPKTHNLIELCLLAGRADESLARELEEIAALNPFGVEYLYPGDAPELLPGDVGTLFAIAQRARGAILQRLRDRIYSSDDPKILATE